MFPIESFHTHATPFYYYDMALLESTIEAVSRAAGDDFTVHYAIKANANPAILKTIAARNIGADCVSGGEIAAAIESGFAPASIMYAGVGKTDAEIALALKAGIGFFNVESPAELRVIAEIASALGLKARIALRVNPDIDAHTHHYINTGVEESKFGIAMHMLDAVIDEALSLPSIDLAGLHFHIGSQVLTMEPYTLLAERVSALVRRLDARGIRFESLNFGGGLGIDYDDPDANPIPDFDAFFNALRAGLDLPYRSTLHCELGRAIVAQCGSLISRLLYVKEGVDKQFAILDAGMTELIRPALYQAHHKIQNLSASPDAPTSRYDVVGPICESSDCFGENELLPVSRRGDFFAIRSAGAYGEAMASSYNCRPLPETVLSRRD